MEAVEVTVGSVGGVRLVRAAFVESSVAFRLSDCYPNCCQEQVAAAPGQVADSGCGHPTVGRVVRPKRRAVDTPEDGHLVAGGRQLDLAAHWLVDPSTTPDGL